jgi:DNA-binding CsgD family transcriptional regulator
MGVRSHPCRTRSRRPTGRATDREVGVVAAVVVARSEKAAAYRLGLSHSTVKHHLANARSKVGATTTAQLVWILAERLPEPESEVRAQTDGSAPSVLSPVTATRAIRRRRERRR